MAGAPRFRDVIQKEVRLKKSEKIIFFAPHISEYFAVGPFIDRISKKFGKETGKSVISDMRERILKTSRKLSEKKVSKEEKDLIEKLFRLEDSWIRLQRLSELLERYPEATILEMHALDDDYRENSTFEMAPYFYRLPNTKVLVLRDLIEEYVFPIRKGLDSVDMESTRHIELVGCFEGLDLAKVREKHTRMLDALYKNLSRLAMVEIPAPSYNIVRTTGIGFIDRWIFGSVDMIPPITDFDSTYAYNISMEAPVSEMDVAGILRMISR